MKGKTSNYLKSLWKGSLAGAVITVISWLIGMFFGGAVVWYAFILIGYNCFYNGRTSQNPTRLMVLANNNGGTSVTANSSKVQNTTLSTLSQCDASGSYIYLAALIAITTGSITYFGIFLCICMR